MWTAVQAVEMFKACYKEKQLFISMATFHICENHRGQMQPQGVTSQFVSELVPRSDKLYQEEHPV